MSFSAGPAAGARTAVGAGALDRLAVGDDVDRVDDRLVLADAAVDVVGLAVAGVDHVVAERDLAGVVRAARGGRVAVDRVLAGAAGDGVVAEAALDVVVAGAAVDVVVEVVADELVVAAAADQVRRAGVARVVR